MGPTPPSTPGAFLAHIVNAPQGASTCNEAASLQGFFNDTVGTPRARPVSFGMLAACARHYAKTAAQKLWLAEGISRSTWYRRRKQAAIALAAARVLSFSPSLNPVGRLQKGWN